VIPAEETVSKSVAIIILEPGDGCLRADGGEGERARFEGGVDMHRMEVSSCGLSFCVAVKSESHLLLAR
jgi:hypothetical protein